MQVTKHDRVGSSLLDTVDLSCTRGDRLLFEGLAVHIAPGEIVQIHGPNGGGKTTLLRILCGLQPPTGGRIRWRGRAVSPGAPELRSDIQYISHAGGVKLDLTPRENLNVATALSAQPTGTTADTALAHLEIDRFDDIPVRMLSAGQRRRVALARLLTCRAALWILDEPFTALDERGVAIVDAMLHTHLKDNGAVMMASHHPIVLTGVIPRSIRIGTGA